MRTQHELMNYKRVIGPSSLGNEGIGEGEIVVKRTHDASPSRLKHLEQGLHVGDELVAE